jgi:hypothetical protein
MQEKVRGFLANGASRRALMSAGAYLAGAYMGFVMPGAFEALHEALQYAVALNPFTDPIAQITALYDGALHQTAATLNAVGDWLHSVGVEVSQRVREEMERARAFLGPAIGQARDLFCETWRSGTETAAMLRDQIRNAAPSAESVIACTKEMVKTAIDVVTAAAEAYGLYEAGKAFYKRFLSKKREHIRELFVPSPGEAASTTQGTLNLNLNVAIGGGAVVNNSVKTVQMQAGAGTDPTRGISSLTSDKVLWVSESFAREMSDGLSEIRPTTGSTPVPVSLLAPSGGGEIRIGRPEEDLRHRDRFPVINWGESALSESRLSGLKCGAPLRGGRSVISLSDQFPVRPDAKLIIGENGFLQVERAAPQADMPDNLM